MRPKGLPGRVPRTKKVTRTRIGLILSAVLIALTVGTMALTRTSTQAQKKKFIATKEIIHDQASGKLRKPTPEETDAMVDQLKSLTNRSSEGLIATQHSNGMTSMNLEDRFGGVVVGRANADGTTEVRCVFTMEEAAEFLGLEETTSQDQ
jgi:DNA/RNA endonuclease YhcR with UshA esterase domain